MLPERPEVVTHTLEFVDQTAGHTGQVGQNGGVQFGGEDRSDGRTGEINDCC